MYCEFYIPVELRVHTYNRWFPKKTKKSVCTFLYEEIRLIKDIQIIFFKKTLLSYSQLGINLEILHNQLNLKLTRKKSCILKFTYVFIVDKLK